MTTSTTSYSNTPQATDDIYGFTETELLNNTAIYNQDTEVLTLDVLANDLGGKAKTLFSVDGDMDGLTDLLQRDTAGTWEKAQVALWTSGSELPVFHEINIRIYNGKVEVDLTGALGDGTLKDLTAGQTLQGSFQYAIQMGNGTLSYATVSFSVTGESDTHDQPTRIDGDITAWVKETDALMHTEGNLMADPAGFQEQASVQGVNGFGDFALDTTGHWTYTTHDPMDWLGEGETRTDSFTALAADGTDQVVTVTITGTDDPLQVTSANIMGDITEGDPPTQGHLSATGSFTIVDPDLIQAITFGEPIYPENSIGSLTIEQATDGATRTFTWTYSVEATAVENLGLGQNEAMTMYFGVPLLNTNDEGLGGGFPISITFHGTNDAAQQSGTALDDQLTGSDGADILKGLGGNDTLLGLAGDDQLFGGAGDDMLSGGLGANILTGGEGSDMFFFRYLAPSADGSTGNVIADFDVSQDTIVLSLTADSAFASISGETSASHVFDTYLHYDGNTGTLTFDDGAHAFVIATLGLDLNLTADNIYITYTDESLRGSVGGGGGGVVHA